MTKAQLGQLKESVDIRINSILTKLERSLTRQISALDSKFVSNISVLDSNISILDSKIGALEFKMDSKLDALEKDVKHIVVEIKAELGKHEDRLVWRMFFAVSIILISLCPTF